MTTLLKVAAVITAVCVGIGAHYGQWGLGFFAAALIVGGLIYSLGD